jgi:hypothetical protein
MKAPTLGSAVCTLLWATACGSHSSSNAATLGPEAEESLPSECSAAAGLDRQLLLDDFEDGDLALARASNLHGRWYVNNDGTGEQTPIPGAESEGLVDSTGSLESPTHALHTSGSAFQLWGAFAAAHLNASRSHVCAYDLSSYAGLHLSLKGDGSLRVNLGTVATTPIVDGGSCNAENCSDYGKSVDLSHDWQSLDLPFTELAQPDWAKPAALNLEQSLRLSFWAEDHDFEFWVDDLRFYQ